MTRNLLLICYLTVFFGCNYTRPLIKDIRHDFEPINNSRNLYLTTANFTGVIFVPNAPNAIHYSNFIPDIKEIYEAEHIFKECLKLKTTDSNGLVVNPLTIKSTTAYYRQYFCYVNKKGEKIVYINCFLKRGYKNDTSWKTGEVIVMDGGNAYFQIEINLAAKECNNFYVHGEA